MGGEAAGTSINHSQMLLHRLQELLRQGNASDVVLRVQAAGTDEVRVFHSHRLLLGLHSELFRELLSNQSEVVLQEPRDCAAVFDKFVRWGGEGLGALHSYPSRRLSPYKVMAAWPLESCVSANFTTTMYTSFTPSPTVLLHSVAWLLAFACVLWRT